LKARVPHEGGGYLVRTNSAGFRDDKEFELTRSDKAKRRILLFGDSFTAGEGVSNGQRFGDYLAEMIPNLETYNFGMPGTGTDQQYLIYKEFGQGIDHDLLILGVFVENIRRVAARARPFFDESGNKVLYAKPYFTLENGKLVLHNVPPPKAPVAEASPGGGGAGHEFQRERYPVAKKVFKRMMASPFLKSLFIEGGLRDFLLRVARYQPIAEYEDENGDAWQVMRAIIVEWIAQHDKPVLLVPIPLYHYIAGVANPRTYQERLREATEAGGGMFFDPTNALSDRSSEERKSLYFELDGHLTKEGHKELARALADTVAKFLDRSENQIHSELHR
jgi:carbamoyltransferase